MNEKALLEHCNEEVERGWRSTRDRYLAVDPDGQLAKFGYVQRPAAERKIRFTGQGLYDRVNRELVVLPDTTMRLARLEEQRDHVESKLSALKERIRQLEEDVFEYGEASS